MPFLKYYSLADIYQRQELIIVKVYKILKLTLTMRSQTAQTLLKSAQQPSVTLL